MDIVPRGMSAEDAANLISRAQNHERIKKSPLLRVIGIGRQREAHSVRVELIALEVREGGAILHWRANPLGYQMLGDPVIAVTDDRGTEYDALPMESGGDASQWKGEMGITPAPQSETLRVEVLGFGGFGRGIPGLNPAPIAGSWVFEFSLAG